MGRKALLFFYVAGAGGSILSIIKGPASFISLVVCIGYILCSLAILRKGGERVRKAALGFGYFLGLIGVFIFGLSIVLLITNSRTDIYYLGIGLYLLVISVFTIKYLKNPNNLIQKSEMNPT